MLDRKEKCMQILSEKSERFLGIPSHKEYPTHGQLEFLQNIDLQLMKSCCGGKRSSYMR